MAYWEAKLLVLTTTPNRHTSQPTGFLGRREATMAPTVASTTTSVLPSHQSKVGVAGRELFRTIKTRLSAVSAKASVHNDQASQVAARGLIPPIPLPRSFASVATMPL